MRDLPGHPGGPASRVGQPRLIVVRPPSSATAQCDGAEARLEFYDGHDPMAPTTLNDRRVPQRGGNESTGCLPI